MARYFQPMTDEFYQKIGVVSPEAILQATKFPLSEDTYLTGVDPDPTQVAVTSAVENNPEPRVKSPIPFQKQISRPEAPSGTDVHPLRFVPFDDSPAIFSKSKRVTVPKINNYSPRGFSIGAKDLSQQPQYDPNYDSVAKKTPSTVPFAKITGRRIVSSLPSSQISTQRSPNYKRVDKKVPDFSFEKESPRPSHHTLPSFMLGTTQKRSLNLKSLDMNGYKNTDFMNLTSGFGKGWSPSKFEKASPIRGKVPKIVLVIKKKLKEAMNSE